MKSTEDDPASNVEVTRAKIINRFGSFVLKSVHEGGETEMPVKRLIGDEAKCPYLHTSPELALDEIMGQLDSQAQ